MSRNNSINRSKQRLVQSKETIAIKKKKNSDFTHVPSHSYQEAQSGYKGD